MQANKKILVIEDNPEVRENIAEILELSNYEVHTAENGKEGVETALQTTPDLIICDIMMPDVTGIELFERVSTDFPALRDRFVFMTGGAFSATVQQFIDRAEVPRLEKPFDVRDLRRLIRRKSAMRTPTK